LDERLGPRWSLAITGAVLAAVSALVTAVARGSDGFVVVVIGAASAGLAIGLAVDWIVERQRGLIRSRRDLAALTSAPNLAVVPRQPLGDRRPDDVVMLRDPDSLDAEAYRTLRTAFDFVSVRSREAAGDLAAIAATDTEPRGTVVLVTSPRPGEGKSSVAANLAAASAMAGSRVILVDGDLRKPQIHRLFRLPDDVGLSSLLRGEAQLSEVLHYHDRLEDLILMPGGPPPPAPAELLTTPRLAAAFTVFAQQADLVIVDAPPLLAVADPMILARHCDGVLMVATAGLSTKHEWTEALARLDVIDATVLGTVLLDPDDRIHAVPIYRYTPSAVPENWWVSPTPSGAAAGAGGLHVVPAPASGAVSPAIGTPDADADRQWTDRPAKG
jgi:capsular exopolysaccharide synthesis family protein